MEYTIRSTTAVMKSRRAPPKVIQGHMVAGRHVRRPTKMAVPARIAMTGKVT